MSLYISNNSKDVAFYYLVAKLRNDEYQRLYSSITEIAQHWGGIPIDDIHCTLHSLMGNTDPSALCNVVSRYCSTHAPFYFEFTGVVQAESPWGDRIWLMINKTDQLYKTHRDIGVLAQGLSLVRYPTEDWKPHMKILILPKGSRSIQEDDLFAQISVRKVQITTLELTLRVGATEWETIAQFELKP